MALRVLALLLLGSLTSCSMILWPSPFTPPADPSRGPPGLLFQHTVMPLDVDFDESEVHRDAGRSDVKHFHYSVVDIKWDSNAIGEIAREHGIETVHYADLEVLRVLNVWTQMTVHVYGE